MFGVSEITAENSDPTAEFILVLGEHQRLGRDLEEVLRRYGVSVTIQELTVAQESVYRFTLRRGFITLTSYETSQVEILKVLTALYGMEPAAELNVRACEIDAALNKLKDI